jgi:hypothetical protein
LRLRVSRAHASSLGRDSGGLVVAVVSFGRPLHPVGFCAGGLSSNRRLFVGFVLLSKNAAAQQSNVLSITLLFYNYFLGFCFFFFCMHFACFCPVWFVSQRLSCSSGVCVFIRVPTVCGMQLLSHSVVEQGPAAAAAGKEEQL